MEAGVGEEGVREVDIAEDGGVSSRIRAPQGQNEV